MPRKDLEAAVYKARWVDGIKNLGMASDAAIVSAVLDCLPTAEKQAQVFMEHQLDYHMISVPSPMSYCICGKETPIDLPIKLIERSLIGSKEIERRSAFAHASHQANMLQELTGR